MGKTCRLWSPNQQYLLPSSIQDWLPENELVYFLLDTVHELEISAIVQTYEREKRGFAPFHPRMMAVLLLYSYCRAVFGSRQIMHACQERLNFKILGGTAIFVSCIFQNCSSCLFRFCSCAGKPALSSLIILRWTAPRSKPTLCAEKGRESYSKPKCIVEPVFGRIERARGFVQFSVRGLEKMGGEWALVCLIHNLLKLFRTQYAAVN